MADINGCSARKLSAKCGISSCMANKIIKLRKREAKIRDFSKLWEIEGMNRSIMNSLKKSFKIDSNAVDKAGNSSTAKKRVWSKDVKANATAHNNRRITYGQDQSNQTDNTYVNAGLVDTPITVILPVCHTNKGNDIQIVAPKMLQKSPSGCKLTAVYQMSPTFDLPTQSAAPRVKYDTYSTAVQTPSIPKPLGMSAVSAAAVPSSLSPSKERSIISWLNKMPRHFIHSRRQYRAASTPGGIGEESRGLLDRRHYYPADSFEMARAAKQKSRSRSKSPQKKLPRSRSQSKSPGRKQRSRSRRCTVSPKKSSRQSQSVIHGFEGNQIQLSRSRQSSAKPSTSMKYSARKLRTKDGQNRKSYKETPYKKSSRKSRRFPHFRKRREEKIPFFNDTSLHCHDGPLTLHDLENSDVCVENTIIDNSERPAISELPKPIFRNERTPERVTISREHKERSKSKDSPGLSKCSTWRTNEEWRMRKLKTDTPRRRHQHRRRKQRREYRDHRRERNRGDSHLTERERSGCAIL